MRRPYAHEFLLLFGLLLLCTRTAIGFAFNFPKIDNFKCKDGKALHKLKLGLAEHNTTLHSWGAFPEKDCCKWKGIECNNRTGRVVKLDLRGKHYSSGLPYQYITGEISSSLLGLQHLTYLDLSNNYFSSFPKFIGSLTKLQYLNLSGCFSHGTIPPQLGNLSNLIYLDLSARDNSKMIEDHNLEWLFQLSSLKHLDMSQVNLSKVVNWPDKVNMLPSLLHLRLSLCELSMPAPLVLSNANSSSPLSFLDLSNNHLDSSIFLWLFKYTNSLAHLDLSLNKIGGPIPKAFEGEITEALLSNLSSLKHLDMSYNSDLSLKFSSNWVPPFQLDFIGLRSCKLGPTFPQWLQTQKNFSWLDISDARISDTIPNWFWDLSSDIKFLNISCNLISGTIPLQSFVARFQSSHVIDLSYNRFSGPLPQLNSDAVVLNLSNNLFQGTIKLICETSGYMKQLDLSNNFLVGELPKCLSNMLSLEHLNVANNNLSGRIPESFGRICWKYSSLLSLYLHNNNFTGELPSLMNCSSLKLLDFGENRLSGRIPTWIGTRLPNLVVLRLTSNLFVGSIPLQLCQLTSLQILDLSHNNISGTIPWCLNNFAAMAQTQTSYPNPFDDYYASYSKYLKSFLSRPDYLKYIEHASVNTKGKQLEYYETLGLVKVIDLSSNKLKGKIPKEITSLLELIGLNLSRNLLTGIIPQSIGDLKKLESLDLSNNHLLSVIPPSLATLSFLSYLNLSNNNLSGKIPTGTQLQSFDASSYAGNQDLYGLPLLTRCLRDEVDQGPQIGCTHGEDSIQEHANSHEHIWFYTSIAIGFIVGFWGVCGSLMLKSSWRHAYFQFLDEMGDKLYVTIAINKAKLLRNWKTQCYQENIL